MRKVFISYSSKDGDKAARIVGAIEGAGCDCWMAPRDIEPGQNYAEALVNGIDGARVFLLVLSADSQASEHVLRELERAVSKGKKIMAVRLEALSLSKAFEYFLQVTHWIDASEGLDDAALAKVADAAGALASGGRLAEPAAAKPGQLSPRRGADSRPLPAPPQQRTFEEGQMLGVFQILGRLGQGAMGTVYQAQQVSLDRLAAVKTLQGSIASDPGYIARFRREAKAAAALNHPNLVQVYAAGETEGLHWFAMEYVDGETALARLQRKGRLDPGAVIAIGMNVATALEHGWRKAGLIHRDIKPDNIFLSTDGEVKLGDLGLAKSVEENQSLTMTGASMGTPHYVSPEQAEGRLDVDLRADIYSLGCTLFHLLGGEPPYQGATAMAVMMSHVTTPVPDLRALWPECPAELSRVVMKMMQKRPADRQQSHEEVIADLRGAYRVLSSGAPPPAVEPASASKARPSPTEGGAAGERPPAEVRRKPRKLLAVITIAVLGGLAALAYYAPWKKGTVDPLKESSYVGKWRTANSAAIYDVGADHSVVSHWEHWGPDAKGTWALKAGGLFEVNIDDGSKVAPTRTFTLSADGTTLVSTTAKGKWFRWTSSMPLTPLPAAARATVGDPGSVKVDPAKPDAYVGTWARPGGEQEMLIRKDLTGVRTNPDGVKVNGKWQIEKDGDFSAKWEDHKGWKGRLSDDGQSMRSTMENIQSEWLRKAP